MLNEATLAKASCREIQLAEPGKTFVAVLANPFADVLNMFRPGKVFT